MKCSPGGVKYIFLFTEGSLDGPVQIMTGKRERKKVERLAMQSPPEKEKEKFEIKDGRGAKLGDCPRSKFCTVEASSTGKCPQV